MGMRKLLLIIISVLCFMYINGQTPLHMLVAKKQTTTSSGTKVAKIDFRGSGTSTGLTNWNTAAGSPATAVVTISNLIDTTGASTGWSFSSNATNAWSPYSGTSSNNAVSGITGGTAMSGASTQSYQSIWYNYGTISPARYDATKWQFQLSGLNDTKTYTITICGSEGTLGFDNRNFSLIASGATTTSAVEIDGGLGGGTGYTSVDAVSSGSVTLSPSGGVIKIWLNSMSTSGTLGGSATGSDLATSCNMRIAEQ
jgi:hypothetical protein